MKILVAMSGGVDSSVAAKLLTDAGHDCTGCTMKLYGNEDAGISRAHSCCSLNDVADARSVAYKLGMDYFVFNFSEDFREKVIGKFVQSYLRGVTPNPCIDCNRYMKFDKLFDRADILGCDHIATGHYARIERRGGRYLLKKAADPEKDQSYVLYAMTQAQLARTLFPLGELHKSETRRLARKSGFVNAEKPDSQDICFVPDGDYAAFLERRGMRPVPGDIVDGEGHVLGRHEGLFRYTVGQRRGLGVAAGERVYVSRLDREENRVVLSRGEILLRDTVRLSGTAFLQDAPAPGGRYEVKLRLGAAPVPCTVESADGEGGMTLRLDVPVRMAAPGQSAVLYDGDVLIGGGFIEEDGRNC